MKWKEDNEKKKTRREEKATPMKMQVWFVISDLGDFEVWLTENEWKREIKDGDFRFGRGNFFAGKCRLTRVNQRFNPPTFTISFNHSPTDF